MRTRISLLLAVSSFLLILLCVTPYQVAAQELAYGTGVIVDGDPADWDLENDFFADMFNAGNPNQNWPGFAVLSKLYLRYDCSNNFLYALVLDNTEDALTPDQSADDAWIKIYYNGWHNNKLIDGNGDGNTSPRGFEWVYELPGDYETTLLGYEAFAQLGEEAYNDFEAHLQVAGNTASTGKESHGNAISLLILCDLVTGLDLPAKVYLQQNYPNPFNPTTTISFGLTEPGNVSLKVHDMSGRTVASLLDGEMSAGDHAIEFDASDLSTGMYYYTLTTTETKLTRKMLLVK